MRSAGVGLTNLTWFLLGPVLNLPPLTQLGAGNTLGRTWVRGLLSARALVLGSRSTGLHKTVQ
jgi:hypothetical protein